MRILTIVFLALLLLSACSESGDKATIAEDDKTKIRFSHLVGKNTPKGIGANIFKRLVRERLGDKVVMEVYPNGLLYNDDDIMEALKSGKVVQLAAPSLSKLAEYNKKWQVFDLPFLFEDIHAVDTFQKSKRGKELLASLKEYDYVGLAYWHTGMKQLSANKALEKPENLKGLTFRVPKANADETKESQNGEKDAAKESKQPSVLQIQFKALKAETKPIDFSEVYKALQSNDIDGQENTWSNIYSEKYHKVQNHFSETNHGYLGSLVIANTQFWNGLDKKVQDKLTKIIKEVTNKVNDELVEESDEYSRQKIEQNVGFFPLVQDEREEWCKAIWHKKDMQSDWKRIVNEIGSEILEAAKKANKNKERCPFPTISEILSESN
jgi:C4-dicarboxylate-binding protein DctP